MTYPLYVALVWHMHQPLYKDRLTRQSSMPWVRLHGVKDYLDMVSILRDYPRIRANFNLVPSLLEQVVDYASGQTSDRYLVLSQIPVQYLTASEKGEILQSFFDLNWEQMVAPYPRYAELGAKRNAAWQQSGKDYERAAGSFSDQEIMDLTVWFNLSWVDPRLRCEHEGLHALEAKGSGFTHSDRLLLLQAQQEIIARVIPTYRHFLQTRQIEITTSPYYHPILPLLADSHSARVAVPDLPLPQYRFNFPEDALAQLQRGQEAHNIYFREAARGLWPSEQSLSPQLLPLISQSGFNWLASSEGILWRSLGLTPHRTDNHLLEQADLLYRPYRLPGPGYDLSIIFRDAYLSDLIGFHYWRSDNRQGAEHFYHHLKRIQRQLASRDPYPYLLTIALDGENCWEFYHRDGHPFLETLYTLLQRDASIETVRVQDYLDQYPPVGQLDYLHAGSWIGSDFRTWIGDPTKNRAWDYLYLARQALSEHEHTLNEDDLSAAWDELYVAEGSDWFWWFGEGHSSTHDDLFDATFRGHLKNIYTLLKLPIPAYLETSIAQQVGVHPTNNDSPISTMQPSQEFADAP